MNSFDQYRAAKQQYGGRIRGASLDWKKWVVPAVLLVFTAICWAFAIPGYLSLSNSQAASAQTAEPTNTGPKVQPGALLTERKPDELAIVFLDIGQGDATFIQTPEQKTMLIDTGEGDNPDFEFARKVDAGNRLILPFLARNKIERINYFVGTHAHSDHIGAAEAILKNIPVDKVWIPGANHPSVSKIALLDAIKETGVPLKVSAQVGGTLKIGQEIDMGAGIKAYILYMDPKSHENINNSSIVILIRYGENSVLLPGDAESEVELKIIKKWGDQIHADVLKAGHHGSRTSSTQPWIDFVKPEHTVFMVGSYNTFGHPTDEVIHRVKEAGSKVHRTDEDGTIFMFMDGKNIRIIKRRDLGVYK
jgi:competence protein ComEC